ncbi:MAG: hypothetical protein U5L96_11995 [Owenweeksia sp.]|nr:hypothetical protein [Owenweeksia sp.]
MKERFRHLHDEMNQKFVVPSFVPLEEFKQYDTKVRIIAVNIAKEINSRKLTIENYQEHLQKYPHSFDFLFDRYLLKALPEVFQVKSTLLMNL